MSATWPRRFRARGAASVSTGLCDLMSPTDFGPALDAADQSLGGFDTVILSAGIFGTQDELANDRARAAAVLTANFTNSVLFCEEARVRLLARGGGRLAVFSSVAGERGRKPVVIYGATKAGLSAYLEGLDSPTAPRPSSPPRSPLIRASMTQNSRSRPSSAIPTTWRRPCWPSCAAPVVYARPSGPS
jgi:NAD(P)-dependent dehydrogenase (short-subunit alcohol dehydrogenase family)